MRFLILLVLFVVLPTSCMYKMHENYMADTKHFTTEGTVTRLVEEYQGESGTTYYKVCARTKYGLAEKYVEADFSGYKEGMKVIVSVHRHKSGHTWQDF